MVFTPKELRKCSPSRAVLSVFVASDQNTVTCSSFERSCYPCKHSEGHHRRFPCLQKERQTRRVLKGTRTGGIGMSLCCLSGVQRSEAGTQMSMCHRSVSMQVSVHRGRLGSLVCQQQPAHLHSGLTSEQCSPPKEPMTGIEKGR